MEKGNETVSLERISNLILDKKKENLKYNKQEIPDKLKYNSDDEESFISKDNKKINEDCVGGGDEKINLNIDTKEINNNIEQDNKEEIKENKEKEEKEETEEKEKNSYKSLLLKKMQNLSDDDNENNTNIDTINKLKKEEIENNKKGEEKEKAENNKKEEIKELSIIDEKIEDKKETNEKKEKEEKEDNDKYSSKTFSTKIELTTIKENVKEKKNVLKLLSLIKNKMTEKEKIDKEKETAKEEMFKRAKSERGEKINDDNKSPKSSLNKIIYNKKRKHDKSNKSVNIKVFNSIEKDSELNSNQRKCNIYKHHIPNKSMDNDLDKKIMKKNKKLNLQKILYNNGTVNNIYNNIKKTRIQGGKSFGKKNENKKVINNYYFSNGNYNFNNFFHNNLSPKNTNKIYRKKNLSLKENYVDSSNDYINSYSKYNILSNDISSENNYKTHIENYDSSPNFSSMNSNRYGSKNKINLKVNKKSFYIKTSNYELENISFKNNQYTTSNNINSPIKYINNNKIIEKNKKVFNKNYSQKRNYIIEDIYSTDNSSKSNNIIEIYNHKKTIRKKKLWNFFKIEDLLIIEEKILTLIEYIKYNKEIYKQSFDIFNFYFNCSLYKKLETIFVNEKHIYIVKLSIKYILISLIVIYEYSFHKNIFNQTKNDLLEIIEFNNNNLYLIKYQIINDIIKNNYDKNENYWIKYLLKDTDNINLDNTALIISYINQNNSNINIKLSNLLTNVTITENNYLIINLLNQIKTKSLDEINFFMKKHIIKIENIEGSLIADVYLRNNAIFSPMNPPYIKTPLKSKQYTLVLDLDETLVNFKIKTGREGYVRLRPFLFGFLEEVSQFYELIIFTSATEAYANSVIEAIEQDKKYFDYIFYRQHTIIIGNEFVKDLTRIGRPLNSTLIIDNMPQNFRFQKENGICIKPFWGQDSNDKTLYNLIPILIDIAKMGGDVRINLNKFKNDITSKITSNIN